MISRINLLTDKRHQILFIVIVSLLCGANTLFNGFVWDDRIYLLGNKVLIEFDIPKIIFSRVTGIEYFPVRDLSLALDYLIWGNNPFGFHLTSLLLYSANCIAVFFLSEALIRFTNAPADGRETADSIAPLVIALLFAAHPIHTETFNWITCRGALLSGLFSFFACHAFLRFLENSHNCVRYLLLSTVSFALALFSKAYCLTLPLVLLMFVVLQPDPRERKGWYGLLPFMALAVAAFTLFSQVGTSSNVIKASSLTSGIPGKAALALQIPFFYLMKFIAPVNLSAEYQIEFASSLADLKVIASAVGLTAILAGFWIAIQKQTKVTAIAIGWFLATLLPLLNLFATHPVVADRYAYLPSYAFCLVLGNILVGRETAQAVRKLSVALLLVIIWGAMTFSQNRVWFSDRTLWEQAAKVKPTAYSYVNLGDYHFWRGEYAQAFQYFSRAREISPADTKIFLYKGYLLYTQNDFSGAVREFKQLLSAKDSIMGRYFLGMAYLKSGDRGAAIEAFRQTLQSTDMDPQGHYRRSASDNLRQLGAAEAAR